MTNALRLTNFSRQAGLNKTRNQWVYKSVDSETVHLVLLLQKILKKSIWLFSYLFFQVVLRLDLVMIFFFYRSVQLNIAKLWLRFQQNRHSKRRFNLTTKFFVTQWVSFVILWTIHFHNTTTSSLKLHGTQLPGRKTFQLAEYFESENS